MIPRVSGGAMLTDRREAGRMLARRLSACRQTPSPLVLGLPRGGVPVAYEVALALRAPLDVFVVRKLGVPGQEEVALGAIASGGVEVVNRGLAEAIGVTDAEIEAVAVRERAELERREKLYRAGRPALAVQGREVILVDDGIATGASMLVAIRALRRLDVKSILVAVPVAPPEALARLNDFADETTCLLAPTPFWSVGHWYVEFHATPDEEVTELLDAANSLAPSSSSRSSESPRADA
jgi:predicted phosphoribosyltransferase